MLRKVVFLAFIVPCILALLIAGNAQAALVPNGDFETGDLTAWNYSGNAGAYFLNVINGSYSGFVENNGVGGVCSSLWSSNVAPVNQPKEVIVSFKVRYKTDEAAGAGIFYDDPFHAVLKTGAGDVNLVTIGAGGINAGGGVALKYFDTGMPVPPPPAVPVFNPGQLFQHETPTILVSARLPYTNCGPVYIRFDVCNTVDQEVFSAAFVDDVDITVVEATAVPVPAFWGMSPTPTPTPCPPAPTIAVPVR